MKRRQETSVEEMEREKGRKIANNKGDIDKNTTVERERK